MDSVVTANLVEIHRSLSASEFEQMVARLLGEMGFEDVRVTARPGDGGIDAEAVWSPQVPGLRIDLGFRVQAKRYKPERVLPPRFVRELRGKLQPGQWGLVITTCRVSPQTKQEGLEDSGRVVLVIDGRQLVDLCQELGVGFKSEFRFDKSLLLPQTAEEPPTEPESKVPPLGLGGALSEALGKKFDRIGRSPIYKNTESTILARWSQRYARRDQNYWYGLTLKDVASVADYGVGYFAYVCGDVGVILLPASRGHSGC